MTPHVNPTAWGGMGWDVFFLCVFFLDKMLGTTVFFPFRKVRKVGRFVDGI